MKIIKRKKLLISIILVVLIFIALHITPNISLRTHMFFIGHPKIAITSDILEYNKESESKNTMFLIFEPSAKERATGNEYLAFKVTKFGVIYLSEYYGGG